MRYLPVLALFAIVALSSITAEAQTSTRSFTWGPAGTSVSLNSRDSVLVVDATGVRLVCPTSDITGTLPNPAGTTLSANITFSRSAGGVSCSLLNADGTPRGTSSDVRATANLTASTSTTFLTFFTRVDFPITIGFNACTLTFQTRSHRHKKRQQNQRRQTVTQIHLRRHRLRPRRHPRQRHRHIQR